MKVLVAGGAGYIGSHCVKQLVAAGHEPVVVDNLVYGHRAAVAPSIRLHDVNLGQPEAIRTVIAAEKPDVVMHFAAYAYVGESVTHPLKYYQNNVAATLHLLEAMLAHGVKKFVFSSTCATYGVPERMPITEDLPQKPINPYGQTKLDVENMLKALAPATGLSFAAFRYFNAAGAAEDGSIGEDHDPETHLIPLAFGAAQGLKPALQRLQRHPWPGNVRELENVVYRSAVAATGDAILPKDLPDEVRDPKGAASVVSSGESLESLYDKLAKALRAQHPGEELAKLQEAMESRLPESEAKPAAKKRPKK